jgi:hypothetical protein
MLNGPYQSQKREHISPHTRSLWDCETGDERRWVREIAGPEEGLTMCGDLSLMTARRAASQPLDWTCLQSYSAESQESRRGKTGKEDRLFLSMDICHDELSWRGGFTQLINKQKRTQRKRMVSRSVYVCVAAGWRGRLADEEPSKGTLI